MSTFTEKKYEQLRGQMRAATSEKARALYENLASGAAHMTNADLLDFCEQILEINSYLSKTLVDIHAKVRNVAEMAIIVSLTLKHRERVKAAADDEGVKALVEAAGRILQEVE